MSLSRGQSLMSTSIERPDLNKGLGNRNALAGMKKMSEITHHIKMLEQDRNTSKKGRCLETNLSTCLGRKGLPMVAAEHYQVGKYTASGESHPRCHTCLPEAKKHMGFDQQMSRSAPAFAKGLEPLGSMSDKGTKHHTDRSQYRHTRANGQRITHVMDMTQDFPRPPLIAVAKPLHDTEDPVVCKIVHERQMTFDADSGRSALAGKRPATCLQMGHGLNRERAAFGTRIASQASTGYKGYETVGELETPVERLKDTNRLRGDLGMTFEQHKYRAKTRMKGKYSALLRPRDHLAPDFERQPEFEGFSTCTPVKILPRNRSHDPMPGWSAEAVDGLMSM